MQDVAGDRSTIVADFDGAAVRADFPILSREINGKRLAYLDSAASAQKPLAVIDAMDHALRHEYANVHRGIHTLSNAATQAYEDAREISRRFINARFSEEIVFAKNATEAINIVAYAWGAGNIGPGDEIILSVLEHHGNIVPWHFLRERTGAVIKWAPISDDGELLIDEYEALFTSKTKLVALTHMSNVTGTRVPGKLVTEIAHRRGVPVLLDGCQSAVHEPVDVQDIGCDFFVFSGHKVYGPSGIGVLYGRKELLDPMPPFLGGGSMIASVSQDAVTYGDLPNRFEAGTPPIVEAIGLGAALNYLTQHDIAAIGAYEHGLTQYAHERLAEFNWIRIFGQTRDKGGIVSFAVDGIHPHDIAMVVDRSGVAVRAGHHCAQPLMDRYEVPAMVRASFGMYSTREDVDQLAEALVKARDLFA